MNNKFYVWEFGDSRVYQWLPPKLANVEALANEDIEFKRGERVTAKVPLIEFIAHPKEKYTDYQFNIPGLPLFSPKLRDALEETGIDNVQYFDTRVITKRGKLVKDDYKVANILGRVKCFDWERSEYDDIYRADGHATHIDRLVLDMSRIHNQRLFRMDENASVLLVADSGRQHLESERITGIKFTELDEFTV